MRLPDGRAFRFVQTAVWTAGGFDSCGRLVQGPVNNFGHRALQLVAPTAIGDRTILLFTTSTPISANQYRNGYISLYFASAYQPQTQTSMILPLSSDPHPAYAGLTMATFTLRDPMASAVGPGSYFMADLFPNPYSGVALYAAGSGICIGVAVGRPWSVTTPMYDWIQVEGIAPVVVQNGSTPPAAGEMVAAGANGIAVPYAIGSQSIGHSLSTIAGLAGPTYTTPVLLSGL